MTRYRVTVEYDGGGFVGWQRQKTGLGVQHALEDAIGKFCGEEVTVFGAGRTDSGVHALGQVAHFDLQRFAEPDTVRDAINFHLKPAAVVLLDACVVDEEFHARFSATGRAYVYRITNRRAPLSLDRHRSWWVPSALDAEDMQKAANVLVGHHDFTTFRASQCQAKSPVKTLDRLHVDHDENELHIYADAPSFLHHQVRNMVGALVRVGKGLWSVDDVRTALKARNRAAGAETAPADGLYLKSVSY